jgi:hypothetical protein
MPSLTSKQLHKENKQQKQTNIIQKRKKKLLNTHTHKETAATYATDSRQQQYIKSTLKLIR